MSQNTNPSVLVTGGAGFVGSHICEQLLRSGIPVVVVDVFNDETSSPEDKKGYIKHLEEISKTTGIAFVCYETDILDEKSLIQILDDQKPVSCIHTASLVMDRASVDRVIEFIETNVRGTQCLLNAIRKTRTIERFVLVSTRSAVGETKQFTDKTTEYDLLKPINPYGATKVAAEALCHAFHKNFGLAMSICRMQPMYGSRCRRDMMPRKLFEYFINGEKFEKYGDGEAIRDWLYVEDAARGILLVLLRNTEPFSIFNFGTGQGTSLNQLIGMVEKITEQSIDFNEIKEIPVPTGDAVRAGLCDYRKAKTELNWESETTLEDGLRKTYQYMLDEKLR